jgi:hypothetical protein
MQIIPTYQWWVVAGVVVCLGCGSRNDSGTFPVTGTVTVNGAPAEGVAVSFIPDGAGPSAVGVTDESGKYSLTTTSKDDGAMPGRYQVTLAKYDSGQAAAPETEQVHADYDVSDEYAAGYDESAASLAPPSKNLLPEKYADPTRSGFFAEVVAGANTHNFDLKR